MTIATSTTRRGGIRMTRSKKGMNIGRECLVSEKDASKPVFPYYHQLSILLIIERNSRKHRKLYFPSKNQGFPSFFPRVFLPRVEAVLQNVSAHQPSAGGEDLSRNVEELQEFGSLAETQKQAETVHQLGSSRSAPIAVFHIQSDQRFVPVI